MTSLCCSSDVPENSNGSQHEILQDVICNLFPTVEDYSNILRMLCSTFTRTTNLVQRLGSEWNFLDVDTCFLTVDFFPICTDRCWTFKNVKAEKGLEGKEIVLFDTFLRCLKCSSVIKVSAVWEKSLWISTSQSTEVSATQLFLLISGDLESEEEAVYWGSPLTFLFVSLRASNWSVQVEGGHSDLSPETELSRCFTIERHAIDPWLGSAHQLFFVAGRQHIFINAALRGHAADAAASQLPAGDTAEYRISGAEALDCQFAQVTVRLFAPDPPLLLNVHSCLGQRKQTGNCGF